MTITDQVTGQVTGQVTEEVERLLHIMTDEMSRQQIQSALGLKGRDHFLTAYLKPALAAQVIEMTLPDVPRSSKQRYRLTVSGRRWLEARAGVEPTYTDLQSGA